MPRRTPTIFRHCPHCQGKKEYASSDKFRVNAQQHKIDVWLIYMCKTCDYTWNATILTRVNPKTIDPTLYRNFLQNDRETAWKFAFDFEFLKSLGLDVEGNVEYDIRGDRLDLSPEAEDEVSIALDLSVRTHTRTGTLLAHAFGVSRSQLEKLVEGGDISIAPKESADLTKKMKRSITMSVRVPALRALKPASPRADALHHVDEDRA